MAGFSSALLTRKALLGGSAKVGRTTNGAKTFALFKKAQKQASKVTQPAKKNAKQAQKKVTLTTLADRRYLISVLILQSWHKTSTNLIYSICTTIAVQHLHCSALCKAFCCRRLMQSAQHLLKVVGSLFVVWLQVSKSKPGTQQVKKAQSPIRKNFPAPQGTRSTKKYGKSQQQDQLWLPNTERPGWLDGSMPGLLSHIPKAS